MANTKLDRIERDIEKTRAKILEQQKKLKDLEAQKVEEENAQIVQMVKAVHLDGDAACRVPLRLRQRRNHLAAAGSHLPPPNRRTTTMKNKKIIRKFTVLLAALVIMCGFSVTAYAGGGDERRRHAYPRNRGNPRAGNEPE